MTLWLVAQEQRNITADRYYQGYKPQMIKPVEAVIYHYTGSTRPDPTRLWLTEKDEYFQSAHFLVERSGHIWQLAALDERTWHAGGATSKLFGRGNVNGRSIGIEIMNVGPVVWDGTHYETTTGKPFGGRPVDVEPSDATRYGWGMWEQYDEPQIASVVEITRRLKLAFPILASAPEERLLGHEHVDPSRKMDPGPAFPWSRIRAA